MFHSSTPRTDRRIRVRTAAAGAVGVAALLLSASAFGVAAQSPDPASGEPAAEATLEPYPASVGAPGSSPEGATYEQWAERWWTWLLNFPTDQDPSLATTCPESPADGPQMLPHTYFGNIQQLTCSVPADRPILVMAGGSVCSYDPIDSDEDLLACVRESDATLSSPSIAVDGRLLPDIEAHHVSTEPFEMPLAEANAYGLPAGSLRSAASGWMAVLSGLAPGTHTIVLRDELEEPTVGMLVAEAIITLEVTE